MVFNRHPTGGRLSSRSFTVGIRPQLHPGSQSSCSGDKGLSTLREGRRLHSHSNTRFQPIPPRRVADNVGCHLLWRPARLRYPRLLLHWNPPTMDSATNKDIWMAFRAKLDAECRPRMAGYFLDDSSSTFVLTQRGDRGSLQGRICELITVTTCRKEPQGIVGRRNSKRRNEVHSHTCITQQSLGHDLPRKIPRVHKKEKVMRRGVSGVESGTGAPAGPPLGVSFRSRYRLASR